MIRILMLVLRNLYKLPYNWIKLWYYASHPGKYTPEQRHAFLQYLDRCANKGANVTIQAYGVENIPKENGFMFFPNHQGLYDVLPIIQTCPVPFSVVSKKEVANIPFLKQAFACMGAYMIDRDDLRQSMQIINQVAKDVSDGRNVLIFAEGTRSKNGNQVGEFKGGSFKAATKAKCPIVPVALVDCFKPFDTNTTKPVTVQVHYLKPLPYEEYKGMRTVEIAALVQERIQSVINASVKDNP